MRTLAVLTIAATTALLASCGPPGTVVDSAEVVVVRFETTAGTFDVEVHPDWAPLGAERFLALVREGYYDDCRFFRVKKGWVVQWGLSGDPEVNAVWNEATIRDDPVRAGNDRGTISFATAGPDTRTTQVYVNLANNSAKLDSRGFAPFGVIRGMDVIDAINAEYAERPDQTRIEREGNAYLMAEFPRLDSIEKASILEKETPAEGQAR